MVLAIDQVWAMVRNRKAGVLEMTQLRSHVADLEGEASTLSDPENPSSKVLTRRSFATQNPSRSLSLATIGLAIKNGLDHTQLLGCCRGKSLQAKWEPQTWS